MSIPLFRPLISEEAIEAAAEVMRSGWLGMGPQTESFENAFAAYTGAPFCVGVNSGTSALHMAVRVLDLPRGSEVITTALTFVSTNHVLLYEGLTPVFADVDARTGNLSVADVASRITDRTGAIMLVHYGGYPCDLDEFYALARNRGLRVIEDCAHACGAAYRGARIGSHGDLHAFSFHAVKNLSMGEGGGLTVTSPENNERLRRLRWLGITKSTYDRTARSGYRWDYDVAEVGFKYNMSDVQAAIGLAQLRRLDRENARRAAIAARYYRRLAATPGVTLLKYEDDRKSSFHLLPILAERRDDLMRKLREGGVESGVHYRRNDQYSMFAAAELPQCEKFWRSVVSLPMHLQLSDEQVDYVCDLISSGW